MLTNNRCLALCFVVNAVNIESMEDARHKMIFPFFITSNFGLKERATLYLNIRPPSVLNNEPSD